ncbi:energy transducer TonB [Hyphomicrobium sp. CS1GBMeth3]|uniref:energy transducer TonB n=1 Tax=Hyphomicrobium sp. CS1GBMeth3 TaxID=1892845 RepID=UPI0009313650|nr:energy transducer TonB [Hyphomicrobium sp. CS1GBMeth3]
METTADDILASTERLVPPLEKGQRMFRLALVVAFLLHAALFIEVGRSVPQRSVGDPSGATDAIAVDIVTEADLKSREAVAMPAAGTPTPPVAPPQPTPEPEPAPEPVEKAAEPAPPQPKEAPPQQEAPSEKAPQQQKTATAPDFEAALPDIATMPQPAEAAKPAPEPSPKPEAKQEPAKPVEKREAQPAKKKPAQKQARLDPSPKDFENAPPGRSAGATRPPGITRSGENDEFGRAVIRALRQTMPPPRGIFGRVTVRLILTPNGDLAEVQMLEASGTNLDQSVVFAAKQTYFPLPPYNATVADRTFTIRYVYR